MNKFVAAALIASASFAAVSANAGLAYAADTPVAKSTLNRADVQAQGTQAAKNVPFTISVGQ